jgi:hypothetical protein
VSARPPVLLDSEPQLRVYRFHPWQGLCTVCLSTCSCLFFDLLAGSRLFLARQEQQQIGVGVTVAKAQRPCWSL